MSMQNNKILAKAFGSLLLLWLSLAGGKPLEANNLSINNVTLENRNAAANTVVVEFDISWDHSWRMSNGEHDAAWVFIKILDGNTGTPTYPWLHGKLYTAGTNPNDGTSAGSNSNLEIVVSSDKIGAFIRRKVTGNGTVNSQNVRLVVDYGTAGAADTDTITAKVYGIEMVYIPEGPFYIGDGNGSSESSAALYQVGTPTTAVQIDTTSKSITGGAAYEDANMPVSVDGDGGISGNASYPTGYTKFYLMKYELSQAQYRDFLNTLSRTQQTQRVAATITADTVANYYVMSSGTSVTYGQSIRAPASGNGTTNPITFGVDFNANGTFNEEADGGDIAMNYISWMDAVAYADWAGLRPITELEVEKAARGPSSPVYGEYAWGTTGITKATGPSDSGRKSEYSATSGPGLANYNNSGVRPFRVGFAATNTTNRISSGAGYYGNMNMNDNLPEYHVNLGENKGKAFQGTHGDGVLTTTASFEGNATNNDWPGINATTARGVTTGTSTLMRGCSFSDGSCRAISARSTAYGVTIRNFTRGARFARTAP